jgi:hemoglobin-like flavoprotein
MTPSQIQLVQSSLPVIATDQDHVARMFYARLFQLDPALRTMFKGDMVVQGQKLVTILSTLIFSLNRPDQIVPVLQALGQRHLAYGVQDSHYATVGSALLWTLERALGPKFTPEMREAWIALFFVASRTMIAGSRVEYALRKAS